MGLLDNTTHQQYYQGNDHGNYQFTSLDAIINQFEVAYVGENKLIPKIKRADIAFHAQRALQELSFDTLKSCKSQEITVPASLKMILPHDYVEYTRVSWVDSAGVKHPLYYTHDTNNPFTIAQEDNGDYTFNPVENLVINGDFATSSSVPWLLSGTVGTSPSSQVTDYALIPQPATGNIIMSTFNLVTPPSGGPIDQEKIVFRHMSIENNTGPFIVHAAKYLYQAIDVSGYDSIDLSADGQAVNTTAGHAGKLRVGLTTDPNTITNPSITSSASDWLNTGAYPWYDVQDSSGNAAYLEWTTGNNTTTKVLTNIDVSSINTIYVVISSVHDYTAAEFSTTGDGKQATNNIDNVFVYSSGSSVNLTSPSGNETDSVTWNNFKSATPSENNQNDYQDYQNDIFWPNEGKRYGLDPQHEEMQVHKFAEDAMYKSIAHAILSTSSYGQALVPRLTKEKFAAVRKAKLRLSRLKLGELTQILRGKSKQIKH